jgi:hypothetical protein
MLPYTYIFCAGISEEDSQRFGQSNKLKTGIYRNPFLTFTAYFLLILYISTFFWTQVQSPNWEESIGSAFTLLKKSKSNQGKFFFCNKYALAIKNLRGKYEYLSCDFNPDRILTKVVKYSESVRSFQEFFIFTMTARSFFVRDRHLLKIFFFVYFTAEDARCYITFRLG